MRLLIQILLALGILLLVPFAFPFLAAPFTSAFWSSIGAAGPKELYVGVIFPIGAFGIIALWISILAPATFLERHITLKKVVLAGLIGGAIAAVTFLAWIVPQRLSAHAYSRLPEDAWIYGGPLIVAVWNVRRFLGQKPNLSPQRNAGDGPAISDETSPSHRALSFEKTASTSAKPAADRRPQSPRG
jgi:hypothetical protein